jgi:hypothetical protein
MKTRRYVTTLKAEPTAPIYSNNWNATNKQGRHEGGLSIEGLAVSDR